MLDYATRHTGWQKWLKSNRRVVARVEEAIRERGPLGNADFQEKRPGACRLVELEARHARAPLPVDDAAARWCGRATHFQKRFDLADRVLTRTLRRWRRRRAEAFIALARAQ